MLELRYYLRYDSRNTILFQYLIQVDKVKIPSLANFGKPDVLANKVQSVEKSKEGVFDVTMINAIESTPAYDNIPAYVLEYIVDSSRGKNHYLVKTTIVNQNLYVFTIQGTDEMYPKLSSIAQTMVNSFEVQP